MPTTPALTEEQHHQVAGYRNTGLSLREISDTMGVSVSTVQRSIKTHPALIRAEAEEEFPPIKAGRRSKGTTTNARQGTKAPLPPASYSARLGVVFDLIEDWNNLHDPNASLLILARHSPEVANAWYTLLLLAGGGYECKAIKAGERDQPDDVAQVELDLILNRIGAQHGTFHVPISQLFTNLFFRGAMCTEAVFASDRKTLADIVIVDPAVLRFRPVVDPVIGDTFELGQPQGNDWVSLDIPSVRYIPFHPLPSEPPYGVPIAQPSVMAAVFLLGMFYDIRRVLAKTGYGRIDVEVNTELIMARLGDRATAQTKQSEIERVAQEITTLLETILVDDIPVHTSETKFNRAVGGAEAGTFTGLDGLIRLVERQLIKALKSMPLLQGVTDGVSEANSNKQWEIYARGIRYLQQMVENLVEYNLRMALRAQGIDAKVHFRLSEVRGIDELRQVETFKKKIEAAVMAEQALYMTPDEASDYVTDHDIPEMYAPLVAEGRPPGSLGGINSGSGMSPQAPAENPRVTLSLPEGLAKEFGENMGHRLLQRATVEPEGATGGLTPIPPGNPDDGDIEATKRFWDSHVPVAAGILSGPVDDDA
jgi:hypothetical protein